MGQKKNLFEPDQIVEQRAPRRQDDIPLPAGRLARHATWPFALFALFLALMTVLTWIGQMGR
jgi:hypothetical protein